MKWYKLDQNKCPICGDDLFHSSTGFYSCKNFKCSFKISENRFKMIIQSRNANKINSVEKLGKEAHEKEDKYWQDPDIE